MKIPKFLKDKLQASSQHFQVALQALDLKPGHFVRLWRSGRALYRGRPCAEKPLFLHIEPTGLCNLSCVMCPRGESMKRQMGHMPYDLFQRVCREVDPVFIAFVGFGEPLLHPDIVDMVRSCVKDGRVTRISTNAMLLNENLSRDLIQEGLHQIWFSIDSPHKENLEKIRVGADFDRIVNNIKEFMRIRDEEKSSIAVTLNFTLIEDNVGEIADMVRFAHDQLRVKPTFARGYGYDIQTQQDRTIKNTPEVVFSLEKAIVAAEEYELKDVVMNLQTILFDIQHPLDGKGPCYFPYYVTAVSWDGKITPCCLFYDYQMDIGNVQDGPFETRWNGEAYQEFRTKIKDHRMQMPICNTCPLNDVSLHNIMHRISKIPGMRWLSQRDYPLIKR